MGVGLNVFSGTNVPVRRALFAGERQIKQRTKAAYGKAIELMVWKDSFVADSSIRVCDEHGLRRFGARGDSGARGGFAAV
jgi:hypothetical protein